MDQQQRDEQVQPLDVECLLGANPRLPQFVDVWHFIKTVLVSEPKRQYDAALEWGRLFAEWSMEQNGPINRAGG